MTGWNHEAVRIGDRERRQVLQSLTRHHARGRIDADELAERSDAVRVARTLGDLQVVLADLGWGPRRSFAYDARPPLPRPPLLPLLLVVAVVLAATGTISWVVPAVGAAVLLLLAPWRRRRWAGHRWGGPGLAC